MLMLLAHTGEAGETGEMAEMMQQMMEQRGVMGWEMMVGPGMMGSGWTFLGGTFWVITWALVIAALVALVRWLWKKGSQ